MNANAFVTAAVPVIVLALPAGVYFARRSIKRGRRAKARKAFLERLLEILAVAESLAERGRQLQKEAATPELRRSIREAESWLSAATTELRKRGVQPALGKAMTDFDEALLLVDVAIVRADSLSMVPGIARTDTRFRFATTRLQERCGELVASARFMSIVAEVEGCELSTWIMA